MAPPPNANLPLPQRLMALGQTLQFAWFIGHFILIASTFRYTLAWVTFKPANAYIAYRLIFMSAAATYGIVVYKTMRARTKQRTPQLSPLALAADENVQYLLMALVWLFAPRHILATLPYGIYSFFHVATYIRTNLIPTLFPTKAPTTPPQGDAAASPSGAGASTSSSARPQAPQHPIAEMIGNFVRGYYDSSMSVVSSLEILLWVALLFSAAIFQRRSWILLPIYTAFLRARFSQSVHVQNSFALLEAQVDNLAGSQGTPPVARQAWEGVKGGARQFYAVTDVNKYVNGAAPPKKTS